MVLLLTTLGVAALAAAQPAPVARHDLEALLARPVSPGVIALLLPHCGDARAEGRVVEALAHTDAAVRSAAARVAGVAGLRGAVAPIRRALEAETDRSAAFEELRAAVLLGLPADDLALVRLAAKHGVVDGHGETLATVRGPAALPLLDPLLAAGLSEAMAGAVVAIATRGGEEGLSVVAAGALRTGNARMWSTVLALARRPRAVLSPGLVLAALGSPQPEIRAATYWHLALIHDKRAAPRPDLEAALARAPEVTSPATANVDAAFAHLVLQRARAGSRVGGDWAARAASGTPMIPMAPEDDPKAVSRLLTSAEARALSRRLTEGREDKLFEWRERSVERPGRIRGQEYGGLSFAGGLPPGLLRDILVVTGCPPSSDLRAMGFVEYAPDGRPRKLSISPMRGSDVCVAAAGPVLSLTLAPPPSFDPAHPERGVATRPDRHTVVIVPLDEEALQCADEPAIAVANRVPDEPGGPPGEIREPRKVKNVAPWYPKKALDERREGTVVLEAIIGPSGCIRSARVLRGVSPDLDAVAMIAVGQWRYTPTLLRGKPVPVIMTVTINFKLS